MEHRYRRIVRIMVILTTILAGVVLSSVHVGQVPYQSTDTPQNMSFLHSTLLRASQNNQSDTTTASNSTSRPGHDETSRQQDSIGGVLNDDQVWKSGHIYRVRETVIVPSGVQLTIESGAVVKSLVENAATVRILPKGSLQIKGTSDKPVVFEGTAQADTAVQVAGGTLSAEHLYTIQFVQALALEAPSSVVVQNSVLEGSTIAPYPLIMRNNSLRPISGLHVALDLRGSTDVSGISLAGLFSNRLDGVNRGRAVLLDGANVPAGKEWQVDGQSNAVLYMQRSFGVEGNLWLGPGAILKIEGEAGVTAAAASTVVVSGTAEAPVIFTSAADDGSAGDSNGDGAGDGVMYKTALSAHQTSSIKWQHGTVMFSDSCTKNTESTDANADEQQPLCGIVRQASQSSGQAGN